jgi:hypothetical protein
MRCVPMVGDGNIKIRMDIVSNNYFNVLDYYFLIKINFFCGKIFKLDS